MTPALILGAALWPDGPSPALRRRCARGARLWLEGQADPLITCGGQGRHGGAEALAMAELLKEAGVPAARILLEDSSRNTMENIEYALPLLRRLGASEVLIVSDAFHCPRALMVARHFGLCARAAPVPPWGGRPGAQLKLAAHEALGLPWYLWRLRQHGRK